MKNKCREMGPLVSLYIERFNKMGVIMVDSYPDVVTRTLAILDNEYQNIDLNLDMISSSACVDKYYLCRIFKKTMGVTVQEYLFRKRINYLEILVSKNPNKPLSLLMQKSGREFQFEGCKFHYDDDIEDCNDQ